MFWGKVGETILERYGNAFYYKREWKIARNG